MPSRKTIPAFVSACVLAVAISFGPPATSKTTDYTDVWSTATEDGWSVLFVQQNLTLLAAMYVYDSAGKATWYAAALAYQGGGTFVWSGELFTATGPWFGSGAFTPSAVAVNVVGTMTFSAAINDLRKRTLTYSVNGVQVVKQIQRYTFAYENFTGTYSGVMSRQGSGPTCNSADNSNALPVSVQISQNLTAMAILIRSDADTCTFPGIYSQAGHFGSLQGGYVCTSGEHGTYSFGEMAVSQYDFRSRVMWLDHTGCTWNSHLDGIRLPSQASGSP